MEGWTDIRMFNAVFKRPDLIKLEKNGILDYQSRSGKDLSILELFNSLIPEVNAMASGPNLQKLSVEATC